MARCSCLANKDTALHERSVIGLQDSTRGRFLPPQPKGSMRLRGIYLPPLPGATERPAWSDGAAAGVTAPGVPASRERSGWSDGAERTQHPGEGSGMMGV